MEAAGRRLARLVAERENRLDRITGLSRGSRLAAERNHAAGRYPVRSRAADRRARQIIVWRAKQIAAVRVRYAHGIGRAAAKETEARERACDMPPLDGSDKAVGWGGRLRHPLLDAAHDHASGIGISDDDFAEQVEAPARRIISASWWIDQRDATAEEVAELVQDGAAAAVSSAGAENPY